MLINNRYLLIKPLRVLDRVHPYAEIFEVQDIKDDGKIKVLKILKDDFPQLVQLFHQEASLLTDLAHTGIPKGEEQFSVWLSDEDKLHCLVMERVEGQNLEQWLEQNGQLSQEQALIWLQQIVEILDYVHKKGLFHRDIKPSNIMLRTPPPASPSLAKGETDRGELVLIDFGTARRVTQTVVNGRNVTVVYSDGYTAPEQIEGRAVPQSDFFSLGRTFVHLLTGQHPNDLPIDSQTGRLIWYGSELHISEALAELINQLMAPSWQNRPKDTQIILQRLKEIKQPGYSKLLLKWLAVGTSILLVIAGIYGSYWYVAGVGGCSKIWLRRFSTSDRLSCGEEILVLGTEVQDKQQGVKAFAAGHYSKAVDWLEKAWQQRRDPETLIYLNNARLMQQKAYTIAVVAPIRNNRDTALEILRGVAMAQNEINQREKMNGTGLKVLIADDTNNTEQAKQVASELVSKSDILAVIGHFSSEVTLAAAPIYKEHQLVLISPTSTSEDLSIFRTVSSDSATAEALVNYLVKLGQEKKVAIFYNPQSNYSDSLQKQFSISLQKSGGQIMKKRFALSDSFFNSVDAINQARQQGATAIALLPDSQISSNAFRNALKVIKANQGRYLIVGGDSLYNAEILEDIGAKDAANRLVLAIPWHSLSSPNSEFTSAAEKLWGGDVSWRTALAYDATRALITALAKQPHPNRISLEQTLTDPNFKATGATGVIQFSEKGDRRDPHIQLVKVVLSKSSEEYIFVPLASKRP